MVRYQPPTEWQQWVDWLAARLHGRNRWRLSVIIMGILFARGRRTVTTCPRAAGIRTHFASCYRFTRRLWEIFLANLERFSCGGPLLNELTPEELA